MQMIGDIKEFTEVFDKIAMNRSENEIFTDFLDISICCLSGQRYEEQYLSIIKKYKKEEVELFAKLFARMVIIMEADGQGFTDGLGEFFQLRITRGRHGQFFTPQHVTDFMGAITMDETTVGRTVMDPCCGSGRMLLSAAKISRHNYFFGADIDYTCCKMAAINMCLNNLIGEVAWMDSLKWEHWGGYKIIRDKKRFNVPTIIKLEPNTGYIYGKGMTKSSREAAVEVQKPNNTKVTQAKLNFE
jgi:type I restriction-modification system DNA methylase subunit